MFQGILQKYQKYMKKSLLIKIHLYCGLFTLFYLIAFGFSSIVLNHHIDLEQKEVSHQWDTKVEISSNGAEDRDLAENTRDQLGLMGWTPFWLFQRDTESFQFTVTHPGRNYHVNLNLLDGAVLVEEAPKGFLAVLNGLHFLNGNIPNAPFLVRSWAVYQWLALCTMLVSLFVGIWLWFKYRYHTVEGYVFVAFLGLSLLVMLLI